MILDQLNVRSLLSCRVVNKFWNKAASSVMKQRPAWIQVDSASLRFDALYKCASNSQDFPFRGLYITWEDHSRGRTNANLAVQRYLKKFGQLHTHLRLETMFCKKAGTLLSFLSEMKFLEVQDCSYGDGLNGYVDPPCTPSLRILSFKGLERGGRQVLKEIVLAGSSLEKIEHVDGTSKDLVAAIWDTDRVKLVSSMTLRGYSLSTDICHKLVENPPTLTSLTVSGIKYKCIPQLAAMKSVLFASQHTLKALSLQYMHVQPDEMPVFTQLEELSSVATRSRNWFQIFPTCSRTHFPKLRRIQLEVGDAPMKQSYLENNELQDFEKPVETVSVLDLKGRLFPNDAKYLAKLFPQVSHVRVQYPQASCGNSEFDTATSVWFLREFQSLRKLDV